MPASRSNSSSSIRSPCVRIPAGARQFSWITSTTCPSSTHLLPCRAAAAKPATTPRRPVHSHRCLRANLGVHPGFARYVNVSEESPVARGQCGLASTPQTATASLPTNGSRHQGSLTCGNAAERRLHRPPNMRRAAVSIAEPAASCHVRRERRASRGSGRRSAHRCRQSPARARRRVPGSPTYRAAGERPRRCRSCRECRPHRAGRHEC